MWAFGVLFLHGRHNRHGTMTPLATQPAEKTAHQHLCVQTIRFGPSMFTRYGHAGGMDHMGIDPAFPQPARQPEAIASGLIRHSNPRDLFSSLNCFIPPAIQQLQQVFGPGVFQFLQRLPVDARHQAGDQPARQTEFNDHLPWRLSDDGPGASRRAHKGAVVRNP
jgi:hypothetical protein